MVCVYPSCYYHTNNKSRSNGRESSAKLPYYTPRNSRGRRSHHFHIAKKPSEVAAVTLKDIRRIEYIFNSAPQPIILVRRHCVIISFTPIRIIILADRLLLFIDKDMLDSNMKELFVEQLQVSDGVHHN